MNNNLSRREDFFKAGGALAPDSPSYIERDADAALYSLALSGEYCNVCTSRQMGKTTLIARTQQRLKDQGVQSVFIDLTAITSNDITPEEWYYSLISTFCTGLGLDLDAQSWWRSRSRLSLIQRFTEFLQQVVLEKVEGPIVVFIDEIDTTLKLPFADDFFALIRAMYNQRSTNPENKRLTFVLAGVARPTDLIKDTKSTPYNIGTSIDLADFSVEDAKVLLRGLESKHSADQSKRLLDRILHWTGGHPYLTQKLCEEAVKSGMNSPPRKQIDAIVERLFFKEGKRLDDSNPNSVNAYLHDSEYYEQALTIYREILSGKQVKDDEQSIPMSELKLSGLVKVDENGCLQVRNRIYERIFDRQWAGMDASGPPDKKRAKIGLPIVGLVFVIAAFALAWGKGCFSPSGSTPSPSATHTQIPVTLTKTSTLPIMSISTQTLTLTYTPQATATASPTPVDTPMATSTAKPTSTLIPSMLTTNPTSIATPMSTSTLSLAPTPYAVVIGDLVRLRYGPGKIYNPFGVVTSGIEMPVVGRTSQSDWWQVNYDDEIVWVLAELVKVPYGANTVPVVTDVPPTPTLTPSPTPTPPPLPAPMLIDPESGARFEDKVRFKFTWVRRLHIDEKFSIYLRSADGSKSFDWWVGEKDILDGGGSIHELEDGVRYEVESGIGMMPQGEAFWRVAAFYFPPPEHPIVNWSEERLIYKK